LAEDFKLKSLGNMSSILNLFTEENYELGVMDISRKLKVSKSTVHRVLASLENAGLVMKTERQKYTLGFKILELANVMLKNLDIRTITYPHALRIRDLTDETVALHILNKHYRVCLFQVESFCELRSTYTEIGKPLPLHKGSAGKVILSYLKQEEIDHILSALPNLERERIRNDLEEIRQNQFGFSIGERTQGIASVAAPVFGDVHKILGALNISGPSIRFTKKKVEDYRKLLLKETNEISRILSLTPYIH
jgi:DNA-binding IclR family transcriptional regulator